MSKIYKSITANLHILYISQTKLQESFSSAQFAIEEFNKSKATFFGFPKGTKHNMDFEQHQVSSF